MIYKIFAVKKQGFPAGQREYSSSMAKKTIAE
jgi:hypothetical protein